MMLSSMFTRILPQKQQKFDFVWKKFKLQVSFLFLLFASLTLSYFSCTPWLSSPSARHISLISTDEKKTQKRSKNKKAAYEQALGLQTNCAFDISSHVQTERHHSQHPSGLWAWETSASERRTPRLSPFWHTAALQTGGRRAGHLLVYIHNNVPMIGVHRRKHLELLCLSN